MKLTLPLLVLMSWTALGHDEQEPLAATEVCTDGAGCTKYGEMPDKDADGAQPKKGWVGPERCVGKWCLYSNRDFAAGRGISAITNQKCFHLLKNVAVRLETVAQKHWDVDPAKSLVVQEEGKGAVAHEKIKSGTSLYLKVPVMVVHKDFYKEVPKEERAALFEAATQALKARTRKLFKAQLSHLPGDHDTETILRENAFEINLGFNDGSGMHWANYPELGKVAHSCDPNASYNINHLTFVHSSAANQDIEPGTAITLSQLDQGQVRSKRQESAEKLWGHGCTCAKCSLPKAASKESDERLRLIASLEKKLESHETKVVTTDMVDNLLDLYKAEKLWSRSAGAFTLAATNYNGLGMERKARKYARLAVEAGTVQNGPDHGDVHIMRALWNDPKGHFTYKERLPNRGRGTS